MDAEDTTKSTPFIVGMVFFAIGVILIVVLIIVVMYFCIYRRRKKQFEKRKYVTMDNSIVYTKSPPSLDLRPPSISKEVNENGNIQTMTTMTPLESPDTVYTIENGTARNNVLTSASEPRLSRSFDTVDHSNGKKYILREVYAIDGSNLTKKKQKTAHKKKNRKIGKAYSTSYSWNRRGGGPNSLLGKTKKRKELHYPHSERGYRTAYTNSFYHTDTLPSRSKKSHDDHYGSAPTMVKLQPVSFATMPRHHNSSLSSSQRLYLVSDNPQPLASQSVILNPSPPRSPRSPRFAATHSLDGFHNYEEDHHASKSKSLNTSREYGSSSREYSVARDNSTDGNYLKWSPSMKSKLGVHEKQGRVSRSNSDLTSISRSGRKRGIQEHKYIYDPKYGTLEQF